MVPTSRATPGDWTLFWDRDCGFCAATLAALLSLDRHERIRTLALQSPEAERMLASVPLEERMKSAHLVDPDGNVLSGGAATATFLRLVPGGGPLADVVERIPSVPERGYKWVAEHRVQLSRPIPQRIKTAARERIARRAERLAASDGALAGGRAGDDGVEQHHDEAAAAGPAARR